MSGDRVTVTLSTPIEIDGVQVSALTMREPRVRDRRAATAAAKGDTEAGEVRLFAALCDVSPDSIESLTLADYGRLQEVFVGFLRSSPAS